MTLPLACALVASFTAQDVPAVQVDWLQNSSTGRWYGIDLPGRTWEASESIATSQGGHLATLASEAEWLWFESNVWAPDARPDTWIGLTDVLIEGQFKWTSGEPLTWTNWPLGEPSNGNQPGSPPGEDFVHLPSSAAVFGGPATGRWNDAPNVGLYGLPFRAGFEFAHEPAFGWSRPRLTAVGQRPLFAESADLDHDGDVDLVLTTGWLAPSNRVEVLLNDGQGNLSLGPVLDVSAEPRGLAIIERPQPLGPLIVVCCESAGRLQLLEYSATGLAELPDIDTGISFELVVALDANNDGRTDLVASSWSPGLLYLYTASSTGGFVRSEITGWDSTYSSGITSGDFDGDGNVDLLVTSNVTNLAVFMGSSGGSFTLGQELAVDKPRAPAVVDLNGDGALDLAIPSVGNDRLETWLGLGDGTFTFHTSVPLPGHPHEASLADFDGDGHDDVTVVLDNTGTLIVRFGDGTGSFPRADVFTGHADATSVVALPLDGDPTPDLAIVRRGSAHVATWLNRRYSDCDGNGTWDALDLASGNASDCNGNSRHDACDIAWGTSLDVDGNSIPDECLPPALSADTLALSLLSGGTQHLALDAGSTRAFHLFVLLGTATGTTPGTLEPVTGQVVPLNVDAYFLFLYQNAGAGLLTPFFGFLSPIGAATASFTVPAASNASLAGLVLHHAFITIDFFGAGQMSFVSNALPVQLMP
jgi:hypothetical protein